MTEKNSNTKISLNIIYYIFNESAKEIDETSSVYNSIRLTIYLSEKCHPDDQRPNAVVQ